jgi:hypothetical protein
MPAGVHTGKSVTEPLRSQIIIALASGESLAAIAKRSRLGYTTVLAVRNAEWRRVEERKPILAAMAERNALLAADQIGDALAKRKYPIGSLPVVYGVSVDKALALRADPASSVQQHLHLHLQANNVTDQFNSLLARLEDKAQVLPVIESISEPCIDCDARALKEQAPEPDQATLVRPLVRPRKRRKTKRAT